MPFYFFREAGSDHKNKLSVEFCTKENVYSIKYRMQNVFSIKYGMQSCRTIRIYYLTIIYKIR